MNPPQRPQQGEINTDTRFIYGDDANVIAYRLGIVETDLKGLDTKLDRILNEYPTHQMLALVLDPLKEKIRELETKREQDLESKTKHEQQIKYIWLAAAVGPIMTILIGLIYMGIGGTPNG